MTTLRGDCPHSEKMICRIRAGAQVWISRMINMITGAKGPKLVKGRNALERRGRIDGVDGDFIGSFMQGFKHKYDDEQQTNTEIYIKQSRW